MASKKLKEMGTIVEMYKRCPKNQLDKFYKFRDLSAKYRERVNKNPDQLPRIDWEFYRKNVRTEFISMVDEFEQKYKELQKVFDGRKNLDTSKYYLEVEKQRCEVECELKEFIAESNKRIKGYENEINRIKSLIPYDQMTLEDFVILRPEQSAMIPHGRKPIFWPFLPDEQTPGPSNPWHTHDDEGLDESGPQPPPPSPSASATGPPQGAASDAKAAPAKAEAPKAEAKTDTKPAESPPEGKAQAKAKAEPQSESKTEKKQGSKQESDKEKKSADSDKCKAKCDQMAAAKTEGVAQKKAAADGGGMATKCARTKAPAADKSGSKPDEKDKEKDKDKDKCKDKSKKK